MADYRAYFVGDDEHIIGFEPLVCADDGEAVEKAKRLVTSIRSSFGAATDSFSA
jgi:hypothetical protein